MTTLTTEDAATWARDSIPLLGHQLLNSLATLLGAFEALGDSRSNTDAKVTAILDRMVLKHSTILSISLRRLAAGDVDLALVAASAGGSS
jgi:hypothetical protein